ncbi:RNA 2',3'-cyclic phosphodiesterase [Myceligenerans pegani]|uniref:RNA 2',3'-cyclic phosphodiesterase n=1 Tax=Myceligenerans pegani TaxID=2776917 RepID=A0ABR9MZH0_9MICO|nr:RNA 2',3'-cyclic phosphodiesterase [Myceligenerans sp. TRM 65318]MBE1876490.1 RNA 2',3'-cyclic phosphodiesterase [Myceligenerans sp. TRM 65318]MBE3018761.1 RNA 2',3'-cyclic phosphodiesterase [Myceligenerans sp. TRM 65318]
MRLFTAVFPPEGVLDHLDLAIHGVTSVGASPRWVPRENRHVTLSFYADVPEGAVDDLVEELAGVAGKHGPLDLRLRGAGSFGSRVLWIGVDGDVGTLRDLAEDCLAASPREVPEDVKPHRPHLTIARARAGQVRPPRGRDRWGKRRSAYDGGRGGGRAATSSEVVRDRFAGARSELEPAAHALSVYAGPPWPVGEFALVQSRPGEGAQGGPRYTVLETFDLRG